MHSLARNHALVDGAEALVVSVASGELDVPALAAPIGSPVRDRLSRRRTPSSPLFLRLLSGIRYGRRMPTRYSHCVARLVAKLGDELMAEVDALVAEGAAASRSDAVRLGLERLVDEHRRRRGGTSIVDAYLRQPQTDDELAGLDEATLALVAAEPW